MVSDNELASIYEEVDRIAGLSAQLETSACAPDSRGWGVPDWRDNDAYPKPQDRLLDEWRWEFLRRNHGYRHDFFQPDECFPVSKARYFERAYGVQWISDPRIAVHNVDEWWPPSSEDDALFFGRRDRLEGLVRFIDTSWTRTITDKYEFDRILESDDAATGLFMRIDLRKPSKSQFERLRAIAEEYQSSWNVKQTRERRDLWPRHIRVLDARDDGAKQTQIAASILRLENPISSEGRDIIKPAEALRRDWPY